MFVENKYYSWYLMLVNSRKSRGLRKQDLSFYTEKHHIIPKSLGGTDSKDNFVLLTAREHYIAHWLLVKCTEGPAKFKMACGFYRITNQSGKEQKRVFSSRQYQTAKEVHAKEKSLSYTGKKYNRKPLTEQVKKNLAAGMRKTRLHLENDPSAEARRRKSISDANKSRPRHENSLKNLNHEFTAESRAKAEMTKVMKRKKFVEVDGQVCFLAISYAAEAAGITDTAARYRIASDKYDWKMV